MTVERFKRASARDDAHFHEHFLGREARCVEFVLGWGKGPVCVDSLPASMCTISPSRKIWSLIIKVHLTVWDGGVL
jgi:hypothetical protein